MLVRVQDSEWLIEGEGLYTPGSPVVIQNVEKQVAHSVWTSTHMVNRGLRFIHIP